MYIVIRSITEDFNPTEMTWILLLQGLLLLNIKYVTNMDLKGKAFPIQELNREASSGEREPPNYASWIKDNNVSQYEYRGGSYATAETPYMGYSNHHSPLHATGYIDPYSHVHQKYVPSIFIYKPNFTGRDSNEHPHILPPGGKSIHQLQEEADFRLKKLLVESRENSKLIEGKIRKLTDAYGFGTIGYMGYENSIGYEPIDLGTHSIIDLGAAIEDQNGNLRLAEQIVRVTNTLGARIPQTYPMAVIGEIGHKSSDVTQTGWSSFGGGFFG